MLGTIINSLTIIIGGIIGVFLKGKLNEKVSKTIMDGLALCIIYIGISGALKANNTIVIIISIAIGALVGEVLDLDKTINSLGYKLEEKINKNKKEIPIAQGFITTTLLFCIGAMAIIGSLESGLNHNHDTLFAKSMLDGISSIIFASSLGVGVILSSISVFIYQGSITLCSSLLSLILTENVIQNITSCGSLLIIALGLNMLNVTKIKVVNLLPSIIIITIISFFI